MCFGAISRIWILERVVIAAFLFPNSSAMSANPRNCDAVNSPAGIRQRSMNELPRDCSRTGGVMGEAKHQTPNTREEKHQTPNTKHQINPKHQVPKTARDVKPSLVFEV